MNEPRVALVTGATSGIGRALALRLAQDGWKVLIHGRTAQGCQSILREIETAGPATTPEIYPADFESLAQANHMCDAIIEREKSLDLLVNNAGTGYATAAGLTEDGHGPVMQVNYLVPYLLASRLPRVMMRTRHATLVNVGSHGQWPLASANMLAPSSHPAIEYGRSKLALSIMTVELAPHLAASGISTVCAIPGSMVATALSQRLLDRARWPLSVWLHRAGAKAPSAAEVARALLELAERQSVEPSSGTTVSLRGRHRTHRQVRKSEVRRRLRLQTEDALRAYLGPATGSIEGISTCT